MLHCFHGFLGSRSDFNHFQDAKTYDLYTLCEKSKDDLVEELAQTIPAGDSLLGYSFGGRLALQVFMKNPDKFKQCIVLSAHCGLKDKAIKMQRVLFEQKCAEKLRELNEEEFLKGWNSQALFQADPPIEKYPTQNKNILARFFTEYGLSTQDYLLDDLVVYKDKLRFIYGEKDDKYREYALNDIKSRGFHTTIIPSAGHRVLKNHGEAISKLVGSNV